VKKHRISPHILLFLTLLTGFTSLFCQDLSNNLKNGDLLFLGFAENEKETAIKGSGSSDFFNGNSTMPAFSHVAMIIIDKDGTNILEALPNKGVCITKWRDFVEVLPKNVADTPYIYVGRLKKQYEHLIPAATDRGKRLVGSDYDSIFTVNDDKYYCSELIQTIMLDENGDFLFPFIKMTFKNRETNEFYPVWVKFFDDLGLEIPENALGSNPNDLSKSEKLDIFPLKLNSDKAFLN